MIIRSITLENIRSYQSPTTIKLGAGSTLLFGDIGVGKSTLLYGLEFALFGLSSDIEGKDLLRQGADQGSVTIELQVGGKDITIGRVLKRSGASIGQRPGYITQNGGKTEYSVTEMTNAVLRLFDLNEEPGRTGSVLYRYGIFTPQDEMKAILNAKSDDRLKTLRQALRVEDYATAWENGDELRRHLDRRRKEFDRQAEGLDELREEKASAEKLSAELERAADGLDEAAKKAERDLADRESELAKTRVLQRKLEATKAEIGGLNEAIRGNEREIARIQEQTSRSQRDLKALESRLRDTGVVLAGGEDGEALRAELEVLQESVPRLERERVLAESRVKDLESLMENETCPTCAQRIDPREFGRKLEEAKATAQRAARELKQALDRNSVVKGTILAIELTERMAEAARDAADREREHQTLSEDLEKKKELRDEKERFRAENAEVGEAIQKLEDEVKRLRKEHIDAVKAAATEREGVKSARQNAERLGLEIQNREGYQSRAIQIGQLSAWVGTTFLPSVKEIEEAVLEVHNQRFCDEFTNWFNLLTRAEDIRVWVDDAFSPVVRQGEYELGVKSLSGGERTSLALAYRLALNRLVRATSPAIADGVIILDEPTDGLHKDQLINMRDVLERLGCGQTILVSHEEELMDCADTVIRFEKKHGVSSVSDG